MSNKININIDKDFLIKLIQSAMDKNEMDTELISTIKQYPELMNELIVKPIGKKNELSFFETILTNKQIHWIDELIHSEELKEQIVNNVCSMNSSSNAGRIQGHQLSSFIRVLNYEKALSLTKEKPLIPLYELEKFGKFLSKTLLDSTTKQDKIRDSLNLRNESEYLKPLFFVLLDYFKHDLELLNKTSVIEWGRFDRNDNTIFHHMMSYDPILYPLIVSKIEAGGGWSQKNNKNETPLNIWIQELNMSKNGVEKINMLLKSNIIEWTGQEKTLNNWIQRIINYYLHNQNKDNPKVIELVETITNLPQYESKQVQGFLIGFFKNAQLNPKKESGINELKALLLKNKLEKTLDDNKQEVRRNKI